MEKVLTFSNEQKALIWDKFVVPAGGTEADAHHFIEVCETFGLNPILGDIVFQRFKKSGRTTFITTRDGLLRVATRQPGYVGAPNSAVVKEGDHFELFPSEGKVVHRFGAKRGQIIGAYAVMKHETYDPVTVFVDFPEYFNANSGLGKGNKANVWDEMPSAMIQKIAEVFVLRRQFPLGGLYTREEMSLEEENTSNSGNGSANPSTNIGSEPIQTSNNSQFVQQNTQQPTQQQNQAPQQQPFINAQQQDILKSVIIEIAEVRNVPFEKVVGALEKPLDKIKANEFIQFENKLLNWLEKVKKAVNGSNRANAQQQGNQSEKPKTEQPQGNVIKGSQRTYTLVKRERQQAPSGNMVLKLTVRELEMPILCRTQEQINEAMKLNENDTFTAILIEENGFMFLQKVENVLNAA